MTAPASLAEALAQLQGHLPRVRKEHPVEIKKEGRVVGKYAYADLTDVSDALLPVMAALGLFFTACPSMADGQFMLNYCLQHVQGGQITGSYPLPDPARLGPQDLGKAITYARRYALCAVTGLAPGGDDDDAQAAQDAAPARRSRATVSNAQLDREGRMTRAQASDHDKLKADTLRDDAGKKAQRTRVHRDTPVDRETGERDTGYLSRDRARAIREDIPDHDPEDKPGSILPGQGRAIEAQLSMLGYDSKDRPGRHAEAAARLGLEELPPDPAAHNGGPSMKGLSMVQAAELIRSLQDSLDAKHRSEEVIGG